MNNHEPARDTQLLDEQDRTALLNAVRDYPRAVTADDPISVFVASGMMGLCGRPPDLKVGWARQQDQVESLKCWLGEFWWLPDITQVVPRGQIPERIADLCAVVLDPDGSLGGVGWMDFENAGICEVLPRVGEFVDCLEPKWEGALVWVEGVECCGDQPSTRAPFRLLAWRPDPPG